MTRGWPFVVLRETGPQLPVLSHCGSCNTRHAAKQSATLGQISLEHARVLNYWQGSRVVLHDWAKSTGECMTTACRGDLKASVEADTPELFAEPPSILNGTLRFVLHEPTRVFLQCVTTCVELTIRWTHAWSSRRQSTQAQVMVHLDPCGSSACRRSSFFANAYSCDLAAENDQVFRRFDRTLTWGLSQTFAVIGAASVLTPTSISTFVRALQPRRRAEPSIPTS